MNDLAILELDMKTLMPSIMNERIFRMLQEHGWTRVPKNRYVLLTMYEVHPKEISQNVIDKNSEMGMVLGIEHINLNKTQPIGNIFYRRSVEPKLIAESIELYIKDLVKCELFVVATLSNVSMRIKKAVDFLMEKSGCEHIDLNYGPLIYRVANMDIVHLFDPVSLIEETRDTLLCHDIEFTVCEEQVVGTLADYIMVLRHPSAPKKLVRQYKEIHPNKQLFAIRLFSMSAFQALREANVKGHLQRSGTKQIANFFDTAFDILNGNGDLSKINRGRVTHDSPHTNHWLSVANAIKSMQIKRNNTRLDLALRVMITILKMSFRDAMLVIKEHLHTVKLCDNLYNINGCFETPHGLLKLSTEDTTLNNEKIEMVTATLINDNCEKKLIVEERSQFLLNHILENDVKASKTSCEINNKNSDDDDDDDIIKKVVSENPLSFCPATLSEIKDKLKTDDTDKCDTEVYDSDEFTYNGTPIAEHVKVIIEDLSNEKDCFTTHFDKNVPYTTEDFEKENLIKFDKNEHSDGSQKVDVNEKEQSDYSALLTCALMAAQPTLTSKGLKMEENSEQCYSNHKIGMEIFDLIRSSIIKEQPSMTIECYTQDTVNKICETSQPINEKMIDLSKKITMCSENHCEDMEWENIIAEDNLISTINESTHDPNEGLHKTTEEAKILPEMNEFKDMSHKKAELLELQKTDKCARCLFVVKTSKLNYVPESDLISNEEQDFLDMLMLNSGNPFKVSPEDDYVVALLDSTVKQITSEKINVTIYDGLRNENKENVDFTRNEDLLNVRDEYIMILREPEEVDIEKANHNLGASIKIIGDESEFEINAGVILNDEKRVYIKSQLHIEPETFHALPAFYVMECENNNYIQIHDKEKEENDNFVVLQTSGNFSSLTTITSTIRIIKIPETIKYTALIWIKSLNQTYDIVKKHKTQVDLFVSSEFLSRCDLKNYAFPDYLEEGIVNDLSRKITRLTSVSLNKPLFVSFSVNIEKFIAITKKLLQGPLIKQRRKISLKEKQISKVLKKLNAMVGRGCKDQQTDESQISPPKIYTPTSSTPLSVKGWAISCNGMRQLYQNLNKKRMKVLDTGNLNLNNSKHLLERIKIWSGLCNELEPNINNSDFIDENMISYAFTSESTKILGTM